MKHSTLLWAGALLFSTALSLGPTQAQKNATTHTGILCVADFTEITSPAPGDPTDLGIITTFLCEKTCSFSAENDQQNIQLSFVIPQSASQYSGPVQNFKNWDCGISGLQCGTKGGVTNDTIGQFKSNGDFEGVCKLIGK